MNEFHKFFLEVRRKYLKPQYRKPGSKDFFDSELRDLKDQVKNSKSNDPGAFGEMPFSAHCLFWYLKKEQGNIHLKMGPVRQEIVSGPAPSKGKMNTFNNRPSFNTNASSSNGNFCRPGNNSFRGKGRGGSWGKGASKPGSSNQQKQGLQQNPPNSGPKNAKSKKGKKNK